MASERPEGEQDANGSRPLARGELRRYLVLGAPALGLSLAATTLNAYLPLLARELTSSHLAIGALVSGEGFVALLLPVWIGAASDRTQSRLGRRLPFMAVTAPFGALALVLLPFGRSIPVLIAEAAVWYIAYFTYYAPYRALYSDIVPRDHSGRANGIQGVYRGAGMGAGFVGGALMFPLWKPLPYVVAASVLVVTTGVAVFGLLGSIREGQLAPEQGSAPKQIWALIRGHKPIRLFLLANLLWQLTETGLRSFIVLYLVRGLRKSFSFSAVAMGVVGVAALIAAPAAGKLADRFGAVRVMTIMLVVFGVGMWAATFTTSIGWLFAELPFVGLGGAMALSLPYAIMMRIMPRESHGAAAGLFDVSGGAGALLGPLVTGAAVDIFSGLFRSTGGYAAMWPVLGTSALLSIVFLQLTHAAARAGDRSASA